LTPRRVVTLLKQAGRRNDAGLADNISGTLRAEALRQPAPVEHALGVAAIGLIETITAMSDAIAALKAELATLFDQHAQAPIITSFPGLGPVLGARIVGELGDDPHRFTDARGVRSFAGTGPSPVRRGEAGWCRHDGSATGAWATPATGGPTPG
jgi:transposase